MTSSPDAGHGLRPWWHVVFIGLFLGALLAWALLQFGMLHLTHPVEVWVDADGPGPLDAPMSAATVSTEGVIASVTMEKRWEPGLIGNFKVERFPYRGVLLIAAPDTLESITRVTVRMSTHGAVFDKERFQKEWTRWEGALPADTPAGWEGRVFQTPFDPHGSRLAILDRAVNYEGDAALARFVLLSPLFVLYAIFFAAMLLVRAFAAGSMTPALPDDAAAPETTTQRGWPWLAAGLCVLIAAGVMLEQQHPYYFTQDDNFAQFLPNILYGCETMEAGAWPNWNPHQYLGAPLAEIGTYALTYPGTYLSYAFAAHVLGDRNATLEVFCCLHLLLGYFACYWLGRRLGLSPPLAAAFSLCQVLSGFALVAGRSWYYMTPVYLWAPLLFAAVEAGVRGWGSGVSETQDPASPTPSPQPLTSKPQPLTAAWTIGTGLVIGMFFHAGNAQMWVYGVGLAGLFVLWSCLNGSMPWMRIVQMLPAGLVGLGIAAVLLVPQFSATRGLERKGGIGWDLGEGALAAFAPYPTPVVSHPADQRKFADPEHFGALYFAGSIFSIAWLAIWLAAATRRGMGRQAVRDPWNGLALLTFVLALGHLAKLWTWQAYLPVFNQFNHPAKFLPFFHLFSCAVGGVFLNRAIRLSSSPVRWQAVTFVAVAGLLLYNAYWSRSALFLYAERPYPALPGEWTALKDAGAQPVRIVPLTFLRSTSDDYVAGLQHHFPTVYGISSMGGYDPIIEKDPYYRPILKELKMEPRLAIRKYGVTHLVLHREVAEALTKRDWTIDESRELPASLSALVVDCAHAKPVMQTESIRVFEVNDTTPLAHVANKATQALPVRAVPSGVDVDVSSIREDADVRLNFLWRPGIRVYADGSPAPAHADDLQIRVPIQAGTKRLELRYESPWSAGLVVGGILAATGLLGWWGIRRWI